jgi:nicotinate-nucleotide adenylyltransferase
MARPGIPLVGADELRRRLGLAADSPLGLEVVQAPLIDISSRDLRRRVAEGRSIRYCVPRAVEMYVHDRRLYRQG